MLSRLDVLLAYLDIPPRFDLASVPTVLCHDLLLIWYVLYPVDVFRSASAHLAFNSERRKTGEDQDRCASAGGIVHGSTEALGPYIDVDNDALRFAGGSSVAVGH